MQLSISIRIRVNILKNVEWHRHSLENKENETMERLANPATTTSTMITA